MKNNIDEIVKKISDLEWEIKYCEKSMKEYRFERSQYEIDMSEMYRMYQQKKLEAKKKIETLREILSFNQNPKK